MACCMFSFMVRSGFIAVVKVEVDDVEDGREIVTRGGGVIRGKARRSDTSC